MAPNVSAHANAVAEITRLQTAANSAQQAKRGIWHYLSNTIGPLDWNMVFRNHGPIDAAKDRGPVVFPKIFRRLCDYQLLRALALVTSLM